MKVRFAQLGVAVTLMAGLFVCVPALRAYASTWPSKMVIEQYSSDTTHDAPDDQDRGTPVDAYS